MPDYNLLYLNGGKTRPCQGKSYDFIIINEFRMGTQRSSYFDFFKFTTSSIRFKWKSMAEINRLIEDDFINAVALYLALYVLYVIIHELKI